MESETMDKGGLLYFLELAFILIGFIVVNGTASGSLLLFIYLFIYSF